MSKKSENERMRALLIEIIQILDYSFTREVQDTENAIGLIRSKVDNLLNKNWTDPNTRAVHKRSTV
tara:strand:- start:45 stop:242 length:198 start_codon:yes stop_codon:yes gene_type:complete